MSLPLLILPLVLTVPDSTTPMHLLLPDAFDGWAASEPARIYAGREIFKYMDGAGEVYLAYRFESLLVQRYASPGEEEILVEIFKMGNAQNAFGISTYLRGRGPAVHVGQDGEYKGGFLTFWKGEYYVCVRVEKENTEARKGILKAGHLIARTIPSAGVRPALLRSLPRQLYRDESLRYFYRDEILQSHITLPEGNPLRLGEETEGVLARAKGDKSSLLLIAYADSVQAESALQSARSELLPGAGSTGKTSKGTWNAVAQKGRYLCLVLEARSEKHARHLIGTITRRLR